ncbi:MAG: hypothetical protein P1P90_01405 [Patescibacteria group bacterium]|nr:hypothetical protein [Patescibacteria group bacterium]
MKNFLLGFCLITLLGIPAFSAQALLPPKIPQPIDTSKVIFAPEITPVLEPIAEPEIVIPYVPIKVPDLVIPPELLQGPSITDITMATNDNSALVEWKTNKPATSKVEYGLTSTYTKSLEDKELKTEHAMAIPANEGELHIRISSNDSLNRHSETQDITVIIPEAQEPTVNEDQTETITDDANDAIIAEETAATTIQDDGTTDIKPILEINGVEAPKKQEGGLTATNAILGGLALLLAGVLIGVLVKTSKKE